jgi:hypothetical protein
VRLAAPVRARDGRGERKLDPGGASVLDRRSLALGEDRFGSLISIRGRSATSAARPAVHAELKLSQLRNRSCRSRIPTALPRLAITASQRSARSSGALGLGGAGDR